MLLFWPEHALDATLLTVYWNFPHALGFFYSLNYLAGCPTLSLCLALGRASTLLTLRSWLLLKHGTLFLLLFVTHWIQTRSWCYVLGSGSDTLLMLRAELVLEQSKMLLTLRSTAIMIIRSYNFLLELPTRSCWCYAPPLDAAVWRKSRSWCYALSFVLEHARTL